MDIFQLVQWTVEVAAQMTAKASDTLLAVPEQEYTMLDNNLGLQKCDNEHNIRELFWYIGCDGETQSWEIYRVTQGAMVQPNEENYLVTQGAMVKHNMENSIQLIQLMFF